MAKGKSSVEGFKEFKIRIEGMIRKATKDGVKNAVTIGYTQKYAIYVHENLMASHPNGGQAKYLEAPFRKLAPGAGEFLKKAMAKGATMSQALMLLGLRLQRESQLLVPVDTGALRASAFTRLEKKDKGSK